MDEEWISYLNHAHIVLDGKREPLIFGREDAKLVPVYSLDDLGSREFWNHANDVTTASRDMVCLAARFAIEQGYAPPNVVGDYASCPLNWTSAVQTRATPASRETGNAH